MTDFDIGIGWHSEKSCGTRSAWVYSFVTQEALGELAPNYYKMAQLTILGFYFRVYLSARILDTTDEAEECNEQA